MKSDRKDYPRPQFVRKDWQNLNGEWNFIKVDPNIIKDILQKQK